MSVIQRVCVLTALMLFPVTVITEAAESRDLLRDENSAAHRLTSRERAVLEALTQEQLDAFFAGQAASRIVLQDGRTLEDLLKEVSDLEIRWSALSSGTMGTNANFILKTSIGQPSATTTANADYSNTSGFLVVTAEFIFDDGFESGDTSSWASCVGCLEN